MALVGTCLSEERHTPELLRLFRERIMQPRRAIYRRLIDDALAQGRIAAAADPDTVVDLIGGAYQARYLAGDPFPDGWEERVVDAAMAALGAPGGR
jgi:hypothetical protein